MALQPERWGSMAPVPPDPAKQEARRHVRQRRDARSRAERQDAARALAARVGELLDEYAGTGPVVVAGYLSLPAEPSLDIALAQARERGHAVWVPRIVAPDLEWVPLPSEPELVPGPLGIREPTGSSVPSTAWREMSLLLLPGLSADADGNRLGQGGGFYDRFLADLPDYAVGGPLRAVVLFDDELVDAVPHEPHDQPVDAVVTPSRVVRLR